METLAATPGLGSRSSLDPDQGLGLEIKLRQLGKLVADSAFKDVFPSADNPPAVDIESGEGNSVIKPFLCRICPIFEEEIDSQIDSLGRWRAANLARICQLSARILIKELAEMHLAVHPRVMTAIINQGSLTEDPVLLEMWAGYLVSACTFDQDDERFISIVRFLENISPGQVRLLKLLIETEGKEDLKNQPDKEFSQFGFQALAETSEANDRDELFLDLGNLESLCLIDMHWHIETDDALMRLTPLGRQFYQITHFQN